MKRGHTYDKWKEMGYQVKKGEKHTFNYYGNKTFYPSQVVKKKTESPKRKKNKW
jgi:hypothetical protein